MVSTPPKHLKDTPPLSPQFTVPGGRAGAAQVHNFLQPNVLQSLLKQQHHPPDILSNLLSNPSPAAAAAAAATLSHQQPQVVGEVAQRLAAVFQATIAAQQAAAAAQQIAKQDEDQPENLSSSSSPPKKHCPSSLSPNSNNNNNNNTTSTFIDSTTMKVPPMTLPNGHGQLPMPFSADFLWRFPNPYLPQPPPSPLETMKSQLPGGLGHNPSCWAREDVVVFLRYCEREFDLDKIDLEKFQMNGKALCLLGKSDLTERCSGAGDVIHNILQKLIMETSMGFPPSSPLTPRPPLMTPTSPAFPSSPHPWPLLSAAAQAAVASDTFPNLSHLISSANSVTLSPAPSIDSQNGGRHGNSPKLSSSLQHHMIAPNASANGDIGIHNATSIHQLYPAPSGTNRPALSSPLNGNARDNSIPASGFNNGGYNNTSSGNKRTHSASSSHSDSEDSNNTASPDGQVPGSTSARLVGNNNAQLISRSRRTPSGNAGNGVNTSSASGRSPIHQGKNEPSSSTASKESPETPELNTNGRLLWDFLQQLLNDAQQRYISYIAWKNKDTGVFKIVDPSGLARLWGIQKNHLSMNYDKMSRALRYYYRVNILRKVQGERHCYQFLRNPSELKSIKNISLLRQQMEAQAAAHKLAAQHIATLRGLSPQGGATLSSLAAAGAVLVSQQDSSAGISAQASTAGLHDSSEIEQEEEERPSPTQNTELAGHHQTSNSDEPTDLTLDADEKARLRERIEREQRSFLSVTTTATKISQQNTDDPHLRDREDLNGRPAFDFRRLMPTSMSVKSENC